MRVDLNAGSAIPENGAEKSGASRSSAGNAARNGFAAHEASVSSLAAAALHAPEVRTAKVAGLRTQIAAGSYHVPSHQIAASIVDQLRARRPNGS
jgi:flagellar biosynthesis anti-sigma factor FlgM